MATPVIMPRQGITVESCVIGEWRKAVGDQVKAGDVLFTYETDKSAFEEEAKVDGTLLAIFREADDDVPVLTNVAVIGEPGEDPTPFAPEGCAVAAAPEAPAATPAVEVSAPAAAVETAVPAAAPAAGGAVLASPKAKKLAAQLGVDYTKATGTGPNGMIVEADIKRLDENATAAVGGAESKNGTGIGGRVSTADVQSAAAAAVSAAAASAAAQDDEAEFEIIKHSKIRMVIAKKMQNSLLSTAQVTNGRAFDATEILAYHKKLKAQSEEMGLPRITINDLILYALSRVLKEYPYMNAHCYEDHVKQFKHVHLGIAVDTPRGLMVPALRNADMKTLSEIATESKQLIKEALEGSISPDKLEGSTITLTNGSKMNLESGTPIINPPQVAIIGVGALMDRVRKVDGGIDVYQAMATNITYDHRVIDGAPAGKFYTAFCNALENFSVLLAKG